MFEMLACLVELLLEGKHIGVSLDFLRDAIPNCFIVSLTNTLIGLSLRGTIGLVDASKLLWLGRSRVTILCPAWRQGQSKSGHA